MIHAVIGAQYGDEGKGLLTDYLSSPDTLVVRFNGGAQAGHTVVTPEGRRHEFHSFGAGFFKNARTLLSRHFIVNPILFVKERWMLGGDIVYVDPRARVTTPMDMMLNQSVEIKRGASRHGSCGIGINETVVRCQYPEFSLTVADCLGGDGLTIVKRIRESYLPQRAKELQVAMPGPALLDSVLQRWTQDVVSFIRSAPLMDDAVLISEAKDIVFEGAQGLRLDEHFPGGYPHVTRSRTGLTNVLSLLQEAGRNKETLDVTYVTRCYVTRHGNGPLLEEEDGHPYGWIGPETNVTNENQGRFRYARFNGLDLGVAIRNDLRRAKEKGVTANAGLAMTCLDQMLHRVGTGTASNMAHTLAHSTGLPLTFYSTGPTRKDVTRVGG